MGFFIEVQKHLYSCIICRPTADSVAVRDKREKKGLISYQSKIGTSSLRRHVLGHHTAEHSVLEKGLLEFQQGGSRRKKRKTSKMDGRILKTYQQYGKASENQKCHDQELILLIAKSCSPLSLVENDYFKSYVHTLNPRVRIPDGRKLTSQLIPEFIKHCEETFVIPKLESMKTLSITFDLWMSRGCEDIFDLVVHGMDNNFQQHQVHLRMVESGSITGLYLASVLKNELKKHNLMDRVIACVKDGGSNLRSCTPILQGLVRCEFLDLDTCFEGPCFAHLLSNACNAALCNSVDDGLALIDAKKAKASLQRCITWTKKSAKGRDAWFASCRAKGKKERVMPTPVKTRFVTSVLMMSMLLVYRDVVEHCYSNQEKLDLRQRVPSTETWEIVRVMVDTLGPIMNSCVLSQTRNGWFISDAVAKFAKLYTFYSDIEAMTGALAESGSAQRDSTFENQILIYRKRLALCIKASLEKIVRPLLSFQGMREKYVHQFVALVVDPEFKSLRNPFMRLHVGNASEGRALAKRYDKEVVIPLLISIHVALNTSRTDVINSIDDRSMHTDASEPSFLPKEGFSSVRGTSERSPSLPSNHPVQDAEEYADVEDCFVVEQPETEHQKLWKLMEHELKSFRCDVFNRTTENKLKWLASRRAKHPHVVALAQQILSIPATQIENERVFSLAGRSASPSRNRISTENIDNLVSIVRNYPNNHSGLSVEVHSFEEFSDFLVVKEEKDDLDLIVDEAKRYVGE